MRPNCRSNGVATADAMVCGSAPGKLAPTLITGKSIFGREATGRKLNARIPDSSSAAAISDVPIGRRINGPEMLIVEYGDSCFRLSGGVSLRAGGAALQRCDHSLIFQCGFIAAEVLRFYW